MTTSVLRARGTVAAAGLAAVLALAACGGSSSSSAAKKVASLSGAGATTTTISTADRETAALNWAKCMRQNGVNVPDPQFDSNGRPQFNNPSGGTTGTTVAGQRGGFFGGANRDNPKFQAASQACQKYRDQFRSNFQLDPAQQAQQQKNLLAFAKCMRDQGINFPDPTFDSNGRPQFGSGTGQGLRALRNATGAQAKAFQTCQTKLGNTFRGLRGGPGGPGGAAPAPGA